jgi:hypothetical protein
MTTLRKPIRGTRPRSISTNKVAAIWLLGGDAMATRCPANHAGTFKLVFKGIVQVQGIAAVGQLLVNWRPPNVNEWRLITAA